MGSARLIKGVDNQRVEKLPFTGNEIIAALVKAEASSSGTVRGYRHTMLNDSDIVSTRHARAFVGGLVADLVGHTEVFISGGAEHQGPDGGGPAAIIYSSGH
ncbi:MAG: ring-opening amidohydrolase [Granulosicoccus sp.]